MAKNKNKGDGATAGFGEMDPVVAPPGPTYPDPGPRNHNDADWVRRDMLYKSTLPRTKFY